MKINRLAKPKISVVIVSYNTKNDLYNCLKSLHALKGEALFEVIVSDNGSQDGSVEMVKKDFPAVRLLENHANLGFSAGNNKAKKYARGEYVLFLNPDTLVMPGALKIPLKYILAFPSVGALTCKVVLKSGVLDPDTRRSFPTPWVALTHFSYLDRLFPKSKLFAKYWYGYIPDNKTHEIDVLQGAYCLVKRSILDEVGWLDESYFLDGEDIDLCWSIKQLGYKIIYYPKASIIHIKKASKKKNITASISSGVKAMEIFYRKRLWNRYPVIINYMVITGIFALKKIRTLKLILHNLSL